jgi:hypothetical protein
MGSLFTIGNIYLALRADERTHLRPGNLRGKNVYARRIGSKQERAVLAAGKDVTPVRIIRYLLRDTRRWSRQSARAMRDAQRRVIRAQTDAFPYLPEHCELMDDQEFVHTSAAQSRHEY